MSFKIKYSRQECWSTDEVLGCFDVAGYGVKSGQLFVFVHRYFSTWFHWTGDCWRRVTDDTVIGISPLSRESLVKIKVFGPQSWGGA